MRLIITFLVQLFMNFSTLNVKLLSEFKLTLIVVPSGNPSLIIIRANGVSIWRCTKRFNGLAPY